LHELSRETPLDFFVLYSAAAGLVGSPGQANYAAANAVLDALAHARASAGLSGMSIQWGPFADVGMAAARQNRGERLASRGIEALSPAEGCRALGRLLTRPRPVVGVLRLDARQWLDSHPQMAAAPFWSELRGTKRDGVASQQAAQIRQSLEGQTSSEQRVVLQRYIVDRLAQVLRLDASRVEPRVPFTDMGVDSLMSLELRNRLEADLGLRLPATLVFTYPSVDALSNYLCSTLNVAVVKEPELPRAALVAPVKLPEATSSDDELLSSFDASMDRIKRRKRV